MKRAVISGADIILIPEIPYDLNVVAGYLLERRHRGSRFSIIAVAEGAISIEDAKTQTGQEQVLKSSKKKKKIRPKSGPTIVTNDSDNYSLAKEPISSRIARRLHKMTGIEARVTVLGHVQRGGIPTAFDRWLCT